MFLNSTRRLVTSVVLLLACSNGAHASWLLVASAGTNEVLRYDAATGALVDSFASGGPAFPHNLVNPTGLAFGPDQNLFVSSSFGANGVLRYDGKTGAFLDLFA